VQEEAKTSECQCVYETLEKFEFSSKPPSEPKDSYSKTYDHKIFVNL
jgi:hypothetical protein